MFKESKTGQTHFDPEAEKKGDKYTIDFPESEVNVRKAGSGYFIEITDEYTENRLAVSKEELEKIILYGKLILTKPMDNKWEECFLKKFPKNCFYIIDTGIAEKERQRVKKFIGDLLDNETGRIIVEFNEVINAQDKEIERLKRWAFAEVGDIENDDKVSYCGVCNSITHKVCGKCAGERRKKEKLETAQTNYDWGYSVGVRKTEKRYATVIKVNHDNSVEAVKQARKQAIEDCIREVNEEIETYKEIGAMLQGEAKTINLEKIHMANIIFSKLKELK
jgi:hypothetical protein